MDAIRVTKVENVLCCKGGKTGSGTLHLTAHHLIFHYQDGEEEEMWVPYPLISLVTRLPQTLQGRCPITVRCRTFETFSLVFVQESVAIDVFESVKELTVITSVQQLYAFFYTPNPPFPTNTGWNIYSVREEFGRMGVGTRTKAWRFTDLNRDYSFSPTYPARLVVPTKISDTTLQYAGKYRSKARIPALTYLHWANFGSITRSSQPMVGLTQSRSVQDEKLVEATFQSHWAPESRAGPATVYGATTTNLIVDARPTTNAMANTAKGAGSENMDHYKDARKAYLGIDHIHVMRDSLGKVVEALRETDALSATVSGDLPGEREPMAVLDRGALRRSGWLRHMSAIMEGSNLIVRNVHVNSSHVLIHCSDGWDRTSQLSALAQLCLDPFYRTMKGFMILVEKDWVSFGHKFLDRCGHLSSEKFFVAPVENTGGGGSAEAAQAFFASVQKRFASQADIKETSPVFHQFLESTWQVQRQFPERFEFNERFLRQLYYHLYACQFGTFLFNSERERRVGEAGPPPCERTVSVWDYFNAPEEKEKNLNPDYDPSLDDPARRESKADMGVLFPNPKDIRFWYQLYGRTDEEMNGRIVTTQARGVEMLGPLEGGEDDPAVLTPTAASVPPSPAGTPARDLPSSTQLLESSTDLVSQPSPQTIASSGLPSSPPQLSQLTLNDASAATGSSSEFSLRTPGSPHRTPSPIPRRGATSPRRPPDWTGGVKSIWGKLSTNASTAFSAVQGAYDGVARDLSKSLAAPTDDGESGVNAGELKSRDQLNSPWGEDSASPTSRAQPSYTVSSSNPWDTMRERHTVPSVFLDNPWNTARVPSPSHAPLLSEIPFTGSSSLPDDPTISHPKPIAPVRTSTLERPRDVVSPAPVIQASPETNSPSGATRVSSPQPTPAPDRPPENVDPLGVGFM
ncbi:phosphatases II [Heliocybe sulcata]|uniref:Phosphatases II n=1 Tax=Heliocybe sulcata TaxID=5364 RepID=A0A5C3NBS4_9AGAM|nr:phosphatases II [Heliocybe sulcata]